MIVRGLIAFELPDAPACTQKNTRSHDSPRLDVTLPVPAVWQANRHVNHCAGVGYRKQVIEIAGVIKILTTGFIDVGRHPASAIAVDPDVRSHWKCSGRLGRARSPLGDAASAASDAAVAFDEFPKPRLISLSSVSLNILQGPRPPTFDHGVLFR
jgi:hypothetical protein